MFGPSYKTDQLQAIGDKATENLEQPKGRSLTQDALIRMKRNKASTISFYLLVFFILAAIVGPWFLPHEVDSIYWQYLHVSPQLENAHYFGTDANGRDLLVRSMHGLRVSLSVAAIATTVSLVVGIIYGSVSGYFGGWVDNVMMRFVDIMFALPLMLFVIILMVVFGRNIYLVFVGIGLTEWLVMARIVRGQTLSIKQREFIEAAKASGVRNFMIIFKHIIPNLVGPVVVYATLTIPEVILTESFLSFLGFGVQEPYTSLGVLVSEGKDVMETYPWMLLFPATILVVLLMAFSFLGDGLRDAFDPKDR